MTSVGGTTRRNNVHNSSGTNRSTRSVMHCSTRDHAIRNGVQGSSCHITAGEENQGGLVHLQTTEA
jgi:hypothetical protein